MACELNIEADKESRSDTYSSDWKLDQVVFGKIQDIWHTEIDLFGSLCNAQLPKFVSWRPQPGSPAVNAFSVNWGGIYGILCYAFPPFTLITKCLEKIRRELANTVMVCPVWPAQPWFPILLELTCDIPLLLHPSSTLLVSPKGEPHPLLKTGALQLAVCMLFGDSSAGRGFRNRWPSFLWPATGLQHFQHGVIGVFNGMKIPCRYL